MQPFRVRKVRPWFVVGFLLAGLLVQSGMAQVTKETADVVGQGSAGPVVSVGGANLWRSDTGVSVSLRMPTPAPGTYIYPPPSAFQPVVSEGHPEVYSFWVFAFNEPAECLSHPCDIMDFLAGRGLGGAFSAAGHPVGGPELQLSGHVTINSAPFQGSPLLEPRTAEIHLAVAPHGALQPEVMPLQISTPIGTPAHWWVAVFP